MCMCVYMYVYVVSESNGSLHWTTAAEAAAAALDCGLFIDKLVDTFLYSC